MALLVMNDATHALAYCIEFKDGGEPETGYLFAGTRSECEAFAEKVPAVSYGGKRPVGNAWAKVLELKPAGKTE